MKHSYNYYDKLINSLHLTVSDMQNYIHRSTGLYIHRINILHYLVAHNYSAAEVRALTEVQ